MENNSLAGQAFRNIARRLIGEEVPFMNLEQGDAFKKWILKFFKS